MYAFVRCFAAFYILNGLSMLVAPDLWYELTPGVAETGAFNSHFVRDIGIAFLASGCGLFYALSKIESIDYKSASLSLFFLAGHSGLHLAGLLFGDMSVAEMLRDFLLVVLPVLGATFCLFRLKRAELIDLRA